MTTDRTNMRGLGRRVIGLALLAVLISFSFAILDSRTTKAESLFDRTWCGWFDWNCHRTPAQDSKKQTPAADPAPSKPDSGQEATPAPQAPNGNDSSTNRPQPVLPQLLEPVVFNEELKKPLPKRADWPRPTQVSGKESDVQANVFSVAGGETGVLGASSGVSPIERTERGWMILGLAWYWWAVIGAFIAAIFLWVRYRIMKRKLNFVAEST